jgi:hypothetical protein
MHSAVAARAIVHVENAESRLQNFGEVSFGSFWPESWIKQRH